MPLHWGAAFAAVALSTLALVRFGALDVVVSYLVAVNVITMLTYLYDKLIAGSSWSRIPERLLLVLAFAGGSVGALVGMQLFRHKTSKSSFRVRFWFVVVVQVALVAAYVLWLGPALRAR